MFKSDIKRKQKTTAYLVSSAPVFLVFVQHAFPQHAHDLGEVFVGEGVVSDLLHQRAVWPPRIVARSLTHFGLHLRIVHHHIGARKYESFNVLNMICCKFH